MVELREALQQSEQQLAVLRGYMQSYAGSVGGSAAAAGSISSVAQLSNYSEFLGQLNQAVQQQQAHVERAREAFETQTRRWKHTRSRRLALTQVAERHAESERRRFELAEQNHADEFTLRRYLEPAT